MLWRDSPAVAMPAETANDNDVPIAAAYSGAPGACYVLLRPNWDGNPHVASSRAPVCTAVLDSFNRHCGQPPPYERRAVHLLSSSLTEPAWAPVDVKSNLALVKHVYGAVSLPQHREDRWTFEGPKVLKLADDGVLRLSQVDIVLGDRGARFDVYMLEGSQLGDPVGYNQPRLMFSEPTKQEPSKTFDNVGDDGVADLWRFGHSWFLISYDVDSRWFTVAELTGRFTASDYPTVGASTICSIQHLDDRYGRK